jgi:hypothetical protein
LAATPPSPTQDMGEVQSGVHLPIFEAARSDWFHEGDIHQDHLPLRRHGAEQPRTAPEEEWVDDGAAAEPLPAGAADLPPEQPPTSPVPPPRHLREQQPSTLASSPPPAPAPTTPLTSAGLPRRVPSTNLAPGLLAMQEEQEPPPVSPDPPTAPDIATATRVRSPEQVRSMLSSYRSGVERGRTQAGPESAADAFESSRSDDDPTQ